MFVQKEGILKGAVAFERGIFAMEQRLIELGDIALRSVLSIAILFLLAKLMGAKQVAQMNFFDYVIGISIGSIGAEMAFSRDIPYLDAVLAMVLYGGIAVGISCITNHSLPLRRFFNGHSLLLIENGKLLQENLHRSKFDLNDLMTAARGQGYFNLSDIAFAVLEPNGSISFLPKSGSRPATTQEQQLAVDPAYLSIPVILDGQIMEQNLKFAGKDTAWLEKQLEAQQTRKASEVFLALCTGNQLSLFFGKKSSGKDPFQ